MNTWFTSDTHYLHYNIIKYCNRPFSDINHMTEIMIKNWNENVKAEDIVYHLGDFGFIKEASIVDNILSRLQGQKYLIEGNHDSKAVLQSRHWINVTKYKEINIDNTPIFLCHYAMEDWNKAFHGSIMLHGHSHGRAPKRKNRFDVGVDVFNYTPVTFKTILKTQNQ